MKKLLILIIFILILKCDSDIGKKAEKQIKIWIGEVANYANWCGPWNNIKGEPADDLDECCKQHDKMWQLAKDDKDYLTCGSGLRAEIDATLVQCMKDLPEDTNLWTVPPEDSTEALNYRNGVIFLFSICDTKRYNK